MSASATIRLCLLLFLGSMTAVQAARIDFAPTDLVDVTPGEDLWRYDYTVSGPSFQQSEFFDIYFDPSLYAMLTAGPAPNADWDVLILQQPNSANLPPFDVGIFDAFALVGSPSLSGAFSVSFVYLGTGIPGSQVFEIYDADSSLVETGLTTVPRAEEVIPEPSTLALLLAGLAACQIHAHLRKQSRR